MSAKDNRLSEEEVNGGAVSNEAISPVSDPAEPCAPADGPSASLATRLAYLGPASGTCHHPLRLAAQLMDDSDRPLGGRNLTFAFGEQAAAAVTDASGIARNVVVPAASTTPVALVVRYAGTPDELPSTVTTSLEVAPAESIVRYIGPSFLALGIAQTVSARLTDARDERPVVDGVLTFKIGSQSTQATTDTNGTATAALILPVAGRPAALTVVFAGDPCYQPASSRAPVVAYCPTSFVIWGGNPKGLRVGKRVNFWGAHWAQQVQGGDYDAHADFKGYAMLIDGLHVCQPNARTTSHPPVNRSCWTSKPGKSSPPAPPLPEHIGVIVATSIAKRQGMIYGNIAAVAVLKVDPKPPYGPVPGKPGYGTIVTAIEDSAYLFPAPPALAASQSQRATALPGETFEVTVDLSNPSSGQARSIAVLQRFDELTPASAAVDLGTLDRDATKKATTGVTAPVIPVRQTDESNASYLTRLENADSRAFLATATVTFRDACGQSYPAVTTAGSTRLQIPRLSLTLTGICCVGPGSEIAYELTVINTGHAAASGGTLRLRFPDGGSAKVALGELAPTNTFTTTLQWTVPAIAPRGATESLQDYYARLASLDGQLLTAVAELAWKDVLGNEYGVVEQAFSSRQCVPLVTLTPQAAEPLLPGARTTLVYTLQNRGTGNALQVDLQVTSPDGSATGPLPFSLDGGSEPLAVQVTGIAPFLAAKQADEIDTAYIARLAATDTSPIVFRHALEWKDAAGNSYGPVPGSLQTTEILPVLNLALSAPATAPSGEAIRYTATVTNSGHADASSLRLVFTLPDNTIREVPLPRLSSGASQEAEAAFTTPATQPTGTVVVTASLTWDDAALNRYGPLRASATTNVTRLNEAPVVNAGTDQTITLPNTARLIGTVSDDGLPMGNPLVVTWSKVSGPGTVSFGDAHAAVTTAIFSESGNYVLRLTASDGELTGSDETTVAVNQPPKIISTPVTSFQMSASAFNAIVRDFSDTHPDFERGISGHMTGLVKSGLGPDDKPIFAGPNGRGAITSAETFNQWFNDVPGVNKKLILPLELGETTPGSGILSFESSQFFPIDGQLLGNQERVHNYHFTVEFHTTFTYKGGELFQFTADDDAWIFINKRLVVDLGGVHPAVSGSVELDTMGLVIGQTYAFDLFFAERHTVASTFKLQTSLALEPNRQYIYQVEAIDPDDEVLTYSPVTAPDGMQINATTGLITWNPGADKVGLHDVVVQVSDGRGGTDTQSFTLEVSLPPPNQAPVVSAGADQTITLPTNTANLSGTVNDDGLPVGSVLTALWNQVSGPGTVVFRDATDPNTAATFSDAGTYVLRLSASDSELTGSDELSITVKPADAINQAPSVDAGPGQTITLPTDTVSLNGTVTDDGLPAGSTLTISWSKVSGPGTISFGNVNVATTTASFSDAGTYVLRLTANDSELSSSDEVAITVNPARANQAPVVDAGPDQTITLPTDTLTLNGTVTDDGLPADSTVTITWTQVSGPAPVTFSNINRGTVTVTFSAAGSYLLRLSANDSELTSSDDVTVTVNPGNQPPSVNAGADQTIMFPTNTVNLNGTVSDDGLPAGGTLTITWSQVSGPGTVSFNNPNAAATAATFSEAGTYVLRLSASDGELTGSDDVSVTVKPAGANRVPAVNAGPDQTVTMGGNLVINPSNEAPLVNGQVAGWTAVEGTWQQASAGTGGFPDSVDGRTYFYAGESARAGLQQDVDVSVYASTIDAGLQQFEFRVLVRARAESPADVCEAIFEFRDGTNRIRGQLSSGPKSPVSGWELVSSVSTVPKGTRAIRIRLVATRSSGTSNDAYFDGITVRPLNVGAVTLNGTATDDDLNTLAITWSKVSGPGTVRFNNAGAAVTSATFDKPGTYVVRLTADDSELSSSDDVIITVNPENLTPVVNAGSDQTIRVPNAVTLQSTVTDDGQPAGEPVTVSWSKVSGPGTVIFADATQAATTATFGETGVYVLRLRASDSQLESSDDITITVRKATPCPIPVATIDSPSDGAEITSPMDIVGTVSSTCDLTWTLDYALDGDDTLAPSYVTFATGSANVTNGVLGRLDPTVMLNGTYTIRLTATDDDGQQIATSRSVVLTKNLKIGNFTVSFTDLNVPVAGLPIQVTTTYDSRDKRVGDFGVGWTLDIKNVRLEKSAVIGKHWAESLTFTGPIPRYAMEPLRPHLVTITFPDGKVFKFRAVTRPETQIAAIVDLAVKYVPEPGTFGTLEPAEQVDIRVVGEIPQTTGTGRVELLQTTGLMAGSVYNPTVFKFTTIEGLEFIIEQKFGVQKVTDLNGNTLTISRDGVIHSSGKSVRFERDVQGRITKITDPMGNLNRYVYDTNGDLVSFSDAESNTTTFSYNSTHGLLAITDPRGVTPVRNEYDDTARLTKHIDSFGKEIIYTHNIAARQEVITDRLGNPTVYEYDDRGNVLQVTDPIGAVTKYTYDSNDNQLTVTNALGKTTAFTYDALDNKLTETDPLGNTTRFTYNNLRRLITITDPRGAVTNNAYDNKGRVLSTRDPLGNTSSFTYNLDGTIATQTDALNHITRNEYDNFGNVTEGTDAQGNVTIFTYDVNGNRTSETVTRVVNGSPAAVTTTFQYDKLGRLTTTIEPGGSTSTRIEYNAIGKQSRTIDQLNRATLFTYDNQGQSIRTDYPDGTAEESTYDAEGRRLTSKDRAGRVTSFRYDSAGRLTQTTFPDNASTRTTYDVLGRVLTTTDALGHITTYEYDPNCGCTGRKTNVIDALGNATQSSFDAVGNQISVTDANQHTTFFDYDLNNRQTRVRFADNTQQETRYDALGRRSASVDQAGQITRFEYDELGRLVKVIDALGQATTYTYDPNGRQLTQTDALNRTTSYRYDELSRRTRKNIATWTI